MELIATKQLYPTSSYKIFLLAEMVCSKVLEYTITHQQYKLYETTIL